jgi:hypothetical protein
MHFKNYKLSELYYLFKSRPSYVHPNYIFSIYILLYGISITRPFLTSLSLHPMPDNGACADPTTIAAAAHPYSPPLADCGSSHAAVTAGPTSHLSLPLSSPCMATTFVYAQQIEQDKAPTEATSTFIIHHANK